jgi:protoheme IX farnesyltransferase
VWARLLRPSILEHFDHPLMNTAAHYISLTKPRLLPLVLFSGLPALVLAGSGWPAPSVTIATLLGTALCAGAANALNSYIERDLDAQMDRTATRPLPAGVISPRAALGFGLGLAAVGTGMLWVSVGPPAALIALSAILVYIFIYTLWLKPRTAFAVVVGGFSGAIAPLIADAAIDGHVGVAGWLLFAIIFVWQPPHFYAISLYRRGDYKRAGFPMLVDRIGEDATIDRIGLWTAGLIPLTLAPALLPELGAIYLVAAVVLGAMFIAKTIELRRQRTPEAARGLFLMSLLHLMGLFAAMIVELAVGTLA